MAKPKLVAGVYVEGYRAFARNPMETCPHRYDSDDYHRWRQGWWSANTDYNRDPDNFSGEP